jgi:hypothetical protein
MDPVEFLETEDELKRMMMSAIARNFREQQAKDDKGRANLIANAVWGAVKK